MGSLALRFLLGISASVSLFLARCKIEDISSLFSEKVGQKPALLSPKREVF